MSSEGKVIFQFNEICRVATLIGASRAATLQRAGGTSKFFFNLLTLKSRIENLNIVEANHKARRRTHQYQAVGVQRPDT
jgi:hypothetical protein